MKLFSRFGHQGQILIPIVIVIAAIVAIIGVTIAGVAYTQSLATGQRASARTAEQAVQAGTDDALLRLARNKDFTTASEGASGGCVAGEYRLVINNVETCVKVEAVGGMGQFDGDGIIHVDASTNTKGARVMAMVLDGGFLYLVGYQTGNIGDDPSCTGSERMWRIEKRNATTGAYDSSFSSNGIVCTALSTIAGTSSGNVIVGAPTSLLVDSGYLYIGGNDYPGAPCQWTCWHIEKWDKNQGVLCSGGANCGGVTFGTAGVIRLDSHVDNHDSIQAMALDSVGGYMYLVGDAKCGGGSGHNCYRIERRLLTTGSTSAPGWTTTYDPPNGTNAYANSLAKNSTGLYIGVQANTASLDSCNVSEGSGWFISKHLLANGALDTSFDTNGYITVCATSGTGPVLVATNESALFLGGRKVAGVVASVIGRMQKRDSTTGAFITEITSEPVSGNDYYLSRIVIDANAIYATGRESPSGPLMRLEKRSLADLSLITSFGSPNGYINNASPWSSVAAIALDADAVYVGGSTLATDVTPDCPNTDPATTCWRIEKRDINTGALNPGGSISSQRIITSRAIVDGLEQKFKTTVDVSSAGEVRVLSREELTN